MSASIIVAEPELRGFRVSAGTMSLWVGIILLTACRLWMTSIQRLYVMGGPHDDLLFVDLARHIKHLSWLGSYSEFTFMKGPGYSLWLAFVSVIHVPLLAAQHLYYALTCVVVVAALRPVVRSTVILLVLYAVLLMNPVTVSFAHWYVLREGIYSGQCLLIAGCLLGMATRTGASLRIRRRWGLAAGFALAAVYITREEGVWIAPLVGAVLLYTGVHYWKIRGHAGRFAWLIEPARPLVCAGIIILTICTINGVRYRFFGIVDVKEKNFTAAMGALQRVEPPHFIRMVPVTRETREEIYKVSPAFAKLKDYFEGPPGKAWASFGSYLPELKGTGEIGAGWFIWAFRDAASHIHAYRDARSARHYYARVAAEVNAAVDSGRLKGGPRNNSLVPPWRWEYVPAMRARAPAFLRELFAWNLQSIPDGVLQSPADDRYLRLYEQFLHEKTIPHDPAAAENVHRAMHRDWRWSALKLLDRIYQGSIEWIAVLAAIALGLLAVVPALRRGRGWLFPWIVGIALAVAARCALLLFLDVSSFSAFDGRYLGPAQSYVLLGSLVALAVFVDALPALWRKRTGAGRPA